MFAANKSEVSVVLLCIFYIYLYLYYIQINEFGTFVLRNIAELTFHLNIYCLSRIVIS